MTLDARDIQAESGPGRRGFDLGRRSGARRRMPTSAPQNRRWRSRALTHDRMATLHAKRSATAQELDQAVAALTAAEAQRASAQSRLRGGRGRPRRGAGVRLERR